MKLIAYFKKPVKKFTKNNWQPSSTLSISKIMKYL